MESKNPDTVRITLDMPTDKHRQLKSYAALHGVSMRELILESIDHILQEKQAQGHEDNSIVSSVFKRLGV